MRLLPENLSGSVIKGEKVKLVAKGRPMCRSAVSLAAIAITGKLLRSLLGRRLATKQKSLGIVAITVYAPTDAGVASVIAVSRP